MRGTGKKPNLLVLHTDQLSSWALSSYGGALVDTPHIDRLADEGVRCENYFVNSAVCSPSRGCFLTGRYPNSHGAYTNDLPMNRDEVTFGEMLRREGWETGYAGKWHLDGRRRPGWVHEDRCMGFTDNRFMFNRGHWKKVDEYWMKGVDPQFYPYKEIGDEKTYLTDWLTGKTIQFIGEHRENRFCFMVSYPDPHPPTKVRPPYDRMFKPEDMPLPRSLSQTDLPDWVQRRDLTHAGVHRYQPGFEEDLKNEKAEYCGEVKCIDDNVGRILRFLEEADLLEDTVVVFTTDHGEYMGEHGLMGKNMLYETAYRVPLLIRWPDGLPQGRVVKEFVSTVDFQPTVLSLLGAPHSGREQGRDGSAVLRGNRLAWMDEVFIHHSTNNQTGIFTPEYELAYVKDHDPILFDRILDPEQMDNLYGRPSLSRVVAGLRDRILSHHKTLDSPCVEWLEADKGKPS